MFHPISERQRYLLGLLVREFIETGLPVGSKTLVQNFDLDFSSATVRNELAALDEMGYVTQLHTSAGRIPTEMGYRYFVQRLLGEFELSVVEQKTIQHQFHQSRLELVQWMRLAAAVLAQTSGNAAVVTAPRPRFNRFQHIQLIATQGRLVLMVLVLAGGRVIQQMLTLSEPVAQGRLSATAERLNSLLGGADVEWVRGRLSQLDALGQDVARLLMDALARADAQHLNEIYRDGLVNLLADEGARQAVRLLEERQLLGDVLSEVLEPGVHGVQVVIGGDGRWEALRDCTFILARYGVSEDLSGEIGVVGPTRMAYSHNISAVRYVADIMSGLMTDYFGNEVERSTEVNIGE